MWTGIQLSQNPCQVTKYAIIENFTVYITNLTPTKFNPCPIFAPPSLFSPTPKKVHGTELYATAESAGSIQGSDSIFTLPHEL